MGNNNRYFHDRLDNTLSCLFENRLVRIVPSAIKWTIVTTCVTFLFPERNNFISLSALHLVLYLPLRQSSSRHLHRYAMNVWKSIIYNEFRRFPWCNGYRRRKRTRRYEFKSGRRLIAFHTALIPLRNVWIQLFSVQLWVNSRADWFFSLDEATNLGEGKL